MSVGKVSRQQSGMGLLECQVIVIQYEHHEVLGGRHTGHLYSSLRRAFLLLYPSVPIAGVVGSQGAGLGTRWEEV